MFPSPNEQVVLRSYSTGIQYEIAVVLDSYREIERRNDRWTYSDGKKTLLQVGRSVREWTGVFTFDERTPATDAASATTLDVVHALFEEGYLYFWDALGNGNTLDNGPPILVYWVRPWQQAWDTPMQETPTVSFHFIEVFIP